MELGMNLCGMGMNLYEVRDEPLWGWGWTSVGWGWTSVGLGMKLCICAALWSAHHEKYFTVYRPGLILSTGGGRQTKAGGPGQQIPHASITGSCSEPIMGNLDRSPAPKGSRGRENPWTWAPLKLQAFIPQSAYKSKPVQASPALTLEALL